MTTTATTVTTTATNTGRLRVTTPSDYEIAVTRVFEAPRSTVFKAMTTPEILKRWFYGPEGWSLAVCEMDLQPGGAYRWVWHGPDGSIMGVGGIFQEVTPPERTAQTEAFDQPWYPSGELATLALAEDAGKTTLTLTVRYESREARNAVLKTPMKRGVAMNYDRLADLLRA
jgi:uncharacterized protein YndB with AHSA1/START domain